MFYSNISVPPVAHITYMYIPKEIEIESGRMRYEGKKALILLFQGSRSDKTKTPRVSQVTRIHPPQSPEILRR